MHHRVLVLANPIAGGGRARTLAPALVAALARRGIDADLYFTQRPGDGGARAHTAAAAGYTAIAVVGGDGTVNEVLNGLPDFRLPLAVLPLGTANVLAMELRLPRRPDAVAALVAADRRQKLAVACAGDRRFLLFCGAGLDGAAVHRLSQVRTGTLGKHKWFGPILHIICHWPRFHLRVEFDDGSAVEDLSSVLVTCVRNYGGLFHLTPGIDASDRLLHVLCFRQRSRLAFLWAGVLAFCRLLRPSAKLLVRTATTVRIRGDAPCQIDGDAAGSTPIDVRLEGSALDLFAP
jgi:diacylglycerol kinase family enzyme